MDESHALGNVDCKLNSCCCVHNKSANVTMNILKVKFVEEYGFDVTVEIPYEMITMVVLITIINQPCALM